MRTRLRTTAAVLTVSLSGLLVACGGGGGGGGGSTTPPPAATLSSIAVTPATPSATLGVAPATVSLTATGTYSDSSTKTLTTTAAWTSSAPTVATVGAATGVVTPVAAGTTTITATDGTVSGKVTFTVNPATLSSITITPASPSVALGSTLPLVATGKYSDGTTKTLTTAAAWTSSATSIATVGAATGLVTPVAVGTTTITATDGTITATATLTVTPAPVTLTSIAVTPTSASIAKGLKQNFAATGTYSDGSKKTITSTVTWTSATPAVATITSAGVATGTGTGTSAITASQGTIISASATLTVTPATLVSVAINPTGPTIAVGKTQPFTLVGTFTDASTQDYTTGVTWASSNTATATIVAATGKATAVAIGTTSISINGNAYNGMTVNPVTLTVSATVYAYATNFGEGTVSQYVIGTAGTPTAGELTPLSPPTVDAGLKPFSVSVEPTGQYAYVANYGSASVSEYTIGAGGQLTAVGATGTVATGNYPNGVTIDPADKHAYVANLKDSTVSQFSIGNDGSLIALSPATVTTLAGTSVTNPSAIAIDPSGSYAYVANFGSALPAPPAGPSTITQYNVSAVDGSLSLNSSPTAVSGSGPNAIAFAAVSPTVTYAYVANVGDGTVSQYSISSTGALTPLNPTTVLSGNGLTTTKPFGLAVNPAATYLYVANAGENTISEFSISNTGALTSIGTAAAGSGVSSVTVDATGKYVYGTNRGTNTISQFAISNNGTLTLLTTAVASGTTSTSQPTSIATGY